MSGLVWDVWESWARQDPGREAIVHWDALGEPFRWTYGELVKAALGVSARLLAAGVEPGQVCAVVLRHHRDFYPIYMGISAIGALPAVLAYPDSRLHPDKFAAGLKGMSQRSGLDWILTEAELSAAIGPLVKTSGGSIRGLLHPLEWAGGDAAGAAEAAAARRAGLKPSDPFLLQHSSDTTGPRKSVVLSHEAVLGHLRRYSEAIALGARDRVVSWLPLSHDMGLIAAFHLPLAGGVASIQLDPSQCVSAPGSFFAAAVRERATLSWLPDSAYGILAARTSPEEAAALDLSGLRLLINCSEPIRAESHDRFLERFSASGLRREALAGCYAMAEAVFAATQTAPGGEAARLAADRESLQAGTWGPPREGRPARVCVSSGVPIADCELRILGGDGMPVPPGLVGEVAIRSAGLFAGYRNDPEKTAEALRDGWYLSGDLGFLKDGQLYVIGRSKDVSGAAPRNY